MVCKENIAIDFGHQNRLFRTLLNHITKSFSLVRLFLYHKPLLIITSEVIKLSDD